MHDVHFCVAFARQCVRPELTLHVYVIGQTVTPIDQTSKLHLSSFMD